MLHGTHVTVDLKEKILTCVNTLCLVSCPACAAAFICTESDHLQVWVIRKPAFSPMGRVVVSQLQANAEVQPFRLGRSLDQVVKCGGKVWIPVSRDLNEDR